MTEVKAKAKPRVRKPKPKPKMSLRERIIRALGGVPAPKPTGKKKQAVKPYVRKPAATGGNGGKTAAEVKADKEIKDVLKFADQHPLPNAQAESKIDTAARP